MVFAWEQRKLGEVLAEKISNGIMNQPGHNELNIKHINVVNLYSPSYIHLEELEYVNVTEGDLRRCNVQVGDIFLTRSSLKVEGIAQANILLDEGNLVFDDHIMRLKLTDDFEPFFVKEALNHSPAKKQFMTKSKTGTMTTIGQEDISSSTLSSPSQSEQTHIGNFFRTLDDAITLHKRKLDELRELKKGYLQQMFPQAGERVPRVRFAGFTGEWVERELGDVADIIGGGTPSTNNEEYWNGNIDWYTPVEIGEQIFLKGSQRKITELGFQYSSAKMLPVGTVLFTSRAGIGNAAILTKVGTTNQGFQSIIPYENKLDSYFIFARTHELKKYAETVGAGSTFVEVSGKQMAKMPILMPQNAEQTTIGNFFRNLDDQITAQVAKLEQHRQLKAAYLQKMFI